MAGEPQIIVLGSVTTTEADMPELLEAALAHVRRSRTEPGCLAHGVSRDVEDPLRLVFVERWADRAALDAHFAVPESSAFVEVVGRVATTPPTLELLPIVPRD
ncbi:antibiotic biosynthesis monooxygenase [Aquihabitans sp. G128]|uniref:putative quinol monooxygenase n=1 Tax=Aquihabitans sp. G128 TaxID=2849779 RepID=UPI001C21151B|nr:putative quinol monooxygenase [Aquihabitans sp. G128]QXC59635.1 antibiotic biosynthesis monooxygenase [Aquihabitans sp. G128]